MGVECMSQISLLEVTGLKKYFFQHHNQFKAVDDVTFSINEGETFSLVGESGSGKSTIGYCVIRLHDITGGKMIFDGQDISGKMTKEQEHMLRRKMQMIFQDPMSCLNPRKRVFDIVAEGLEQHKLYQSAEEREEKVLDILAKVGLRGDCAWKYPQQFSGGQRQRVGIARALITEPKLVIADECISALDVSVQAQIINLMRDFQQELGCAYLFITHNLPMARYISDKIGVLHMGHLVECGTKEEIFENPIHPYTKCLISSSLKPNPWLQNKIYTYEYDMSLEKFYSRKLIRVEGEHYILATEDEFGQWTKM